MLGALVDVVLPVIFIALVGVALGRFLRPDTASISKITLYALSPALALDNLAHTEVQFTTALAIIGAYIVFEGAMGVMAWLSSTHDPARSRRAVIASVITGNNGNFGLPISLFAFGKPGLELSLVIFTISVFFTFLVTPAVLSPQGGWRQRLTAPFKLPLVWCALGGALLNTLNWTLPNGLDRGVHLLGQAAIPVLLVLLGLQIGSSGLPKFTAPILRASGLRLLVGPFVAWGVGSFLGLRGLELGVLILSSAMPTAVNSFLLARELGADAETVAGAVTLTTVASVPIIAVVVSLLR